MFLQTWILDLLAASKHLVAALKCQPVKLPKEVFMRHKLDRIKNGALLTTKPFNLNIVFVSNVIQQQVDEIFYSRRDHCFILYSKVIPKELFCRSIDFRKDDIEPGF